MKTFLTHNQPRPLWRGFGSKPTKYQPLNNGVDPICPCKDENCPYTKGERQTTRPAKA